MRKTRDKFRYPLLTIFSFIFLLTKDKLYYLMFPPGRKYGVAFNAERARLGIALLPDTWVTNDKFSETKVWHPVNRPDSGSFRSSKVVVVKSGSIVYDGDTYLRIAGGGYEKLTIGYSYSDTSGWEYKYYNPLIATEEKNVTKYRADSILNNWGLEYK
ncbi:hypothetical protein [Chitinophaga sp. CB10]|uniref:hypothetical protein n=1 Tax=Chitinophaga sp. CB10 TaxID=1891659 RepID=UPI0025BC5D8A|nr:hypothetical protein [Chitinophaga sp. CB10]